jgi:hypothetical protein
LVDVGQLELHFHLLVSPGYAILLLLLLLLWLLLWLLGFLVNSCWYQLPPSLGIQVVDNGCALNMVGATYEVPCHLKVYGGRVVFLEEDDLPFEKVVLQDRVQLRMTKTGLHIL